MCHAVLARESVLPVSSPETAGGDVSSTVVDSGSMVGKLVLILRPGACDKEIDFANRVKKCMD